MLGLILGLVVLCNGASSPREPGQDHFEINRLYYCKGPNLAIGSKCDSGLACRSGFCAGQDITDCRGTCRNKRADGQLAYKVGFMPQYESCVAGHGICGTCGEQVALEKGCTKSHQCRSEWCEGVRTDGCKGTCKARRPDGAAAYEVCRFRGKKCTPDYHSCISQMGICGRCGIPNLVGQQCSKDDDCEEGSYCAPQETDGPADCKGKCVRLREDEEEAYMAPWQPVEAWGRSDYKSCKNYKPEQKQPGHCGYCSDNLLGLGKLCAFDADCEENLWCAGGGSDKQAAISLNRADCTGTCAACPVECGDYGCNIWEGEAASLTCGMRTPDNTYFMPKVRVGIPILGQIQCFGVRTKKLVRLIEDDLTEDKYPYTMHISWSPKLKQKNPTAGKLPLTAKQAAEAEAVDDGIVASPKYENCASIRKIRVQTLSTTGTTAQGVSIISHAVITPKTGCVGIKYGLDGNFMVKMSYIHMKVKAAFEFKSPDKEVTDGEYEMDVPNELMKTLYYGAFMHGHLPMFVRIIAKPRISITIKGRVKPNSSFRLKWANSLVGDASFAYSPEGASFTNEMKLQRGAGDMVGARDQNPFEFFDILDGDNDATLWIRVGYQFSVEVNGLGFNLFPAIGGALRMQKDVAEGCNKGSPKAVFNNVFEGKQVVMKTQILGLAHKPTCGDKKEAPKQFDTTNAMIKMCKDIGNFRYNNELACSDNIINWALSVTTKKKLSGHLDEACKAIVGRMKTKHKMVTTYPYHTFEDAKFSKAYWTYLVTMPEAGPDALALDCDPDATFTASGSINDVCIDIQDLRAVSACERDPASATCHMSKVSGLTGEWKEGEPLKPAPAAQEPTPTAGPEPATPTLEEKEAPEEGGEDAKKPTQVVAKKEAAAPVATPAPADASPKKGNPGLTPAPADLPKEAKKEAKKETKKEVTKETKISEESNVPDSPAAFSEKDFAKNLNAEMSKETEAMLKQVGKDTEEEVATFVEIKGTQVPTEAILMGVGIAVLLGALYLSSRRGSKALSYALLKEEEEV